MKSRKAIILVVVLLIITAAAAAIHLSTRDDVPENALKISMNEEEKLLDIDKFEYTSVSGTRVNGKGEEKLVEGMGIALKDVLAKAKIKEFSKVTVVADDSYTAEISAEEVAEEGKAYLLLEEGELRLVVFGDENSKRSVSDIAKIVVE